MNLRATWMLLLGVVLSCDSGKSAQTAAPATDPKPAVAAPATHEAAKPAEAAAPATNEAAKPAEPVAPPANEAAKPAEPSKAAEPAKAAPPPEAAKSAEPAKAAEAGPEKDAPKKAEPSKGAEKAGGGKYALVAVAAPDKKMERLWKSKCAACHGADGKATTEKGLKMKVQDMTPAAWQTSRSNDELAKAIADGVNAEKDGVKQEMDGYKSELAPEQLQALVQYVRWLGAPK